MAGHVVAMRGVSFGYDGQPVLDDVDLTVRAGEFLAVLGPNGGGKSTLLKLLLGLLQPWSGEIRLFGREPGRMLHKVGYVPQNALAGERMPVSVLDVVRMGLAGGRRFGGPSVAEQRRMAQEVLRQVEMEGSEELSLEHLSGGQQQRVLIARALVSRPELLILDEPTSSIDPHGKFCIFELLSRLKGRMTIIAVSHDLSLTSANLDSVASVNHHLLHNDKPELTGQMLSLLYGAHGEECPMGAYVKDVESYFQQGQEPGKADGSAHV